MAEGSKKSVLVADDHPSVLRSVSQLLSEWGFTVAATTGDGAVALRKIQELRPAIALVDLRLPSLSGLEIAHEVKRTVPETAVLIYTGYGDVGLHGEIIDSGARGFVLKDAPLEDLHRALRSVAAGGTYIDPVASSKLFEAREILTGRERDVLRGLAGGLSNDQIGSQLSISGETVRTHVQRVTRKLGAQNRTHAVALALRAGLIN